MSQAPRALSGLLLITVLSTGCATKELVVLLPDERGNTGKIAITHPSRAEPVVLTAPLSAGRITTLGGLSTVEIDAGEVEREFAGTSRALPPSPASYLVYFRFGSLELTAESHAELTAALADVRDRVGGDVEVIGHTDRVGSVEDNDRLSRGRAIAIRSMLADSIASDLIKVSGRGEREPLIPTDDEVEEPRNRRVEIVVR